MSSKISLSVPLANGSLTEKGKSSIQLLPLKKGGARMTGDELKRWHNDRGLSRERLAELLNRLSPRTVEGWEQDRFKIPVFLPFALETIDRQLNGIQMDSF